MAVEWQSQEYQDLTRNAEAENSQMDQALKNVIKEINELSDTTNLNDSINFNQILSANVLDKFNKIPETQRNAINSEINRLKEQYANDPGISKQLNTLSILFETPTSNTATWAASFDTFSRLVKLQATNRLRDNITNSERRDIKQFIEDDNNKNTVLDTYLSMLPIVPRENMAEGTSWRDRSVINDIKDWIEEKYNKNGEIWLRELDNKIFTGVEIFADYIKNNPTWDGSTAPTEAYIQEKCSWAHAYTADQFKAKFAEKNAARITTNNEKFWTITMENKYNKDKIKKIKWEDNTYTLELTKDDGSTVTATVNNFIENLGIQIDAPEWTAFTNNERQAAINSKKQSWFDDIVNHVEDKPTTPAQPEVPAITEFTTENFDSNLKLFNRVTKEDIVAAIDDAKGKLDWYEANDKAQYTERINEVITALTNSWEAVNNTWSQKILELQQNMNAALSLNRPLVEDWKLWKNTFSALKTYIWVEPLDVNPIEEIEVDTPVREHTERAPAWWRKESYTVDDWTTVYTIDDISQLVDLDKFPDHSCVHCNGLRFYWSGRVFDYQNSSDSNKIKWRRYNDTNLEWVLVKFDNGTTRYSWNDKFNSRYDFENIKNNLELFKNILQKLGSNTNLCYSFDNNHNLKESRGWARYYEKNWKIIKCESVETTLHYYIFNEDTNNFDDMGGLVATSNYGLRKYQIKNEYLRYL